MPSEPSGAKHPTPVNSKTVTIPRIPQDVIDEILDHLATEPNNTRFFEFSALGSLRSCALVSKSWIQACRRHLFHTVSFSSGDVDRWFKTFPVPEESPAHHVRKLYVWVAGYDPVPEKFLEFTPWFPNVEKMTFSGFGGDPLLIAPSLWGSPQSVTSLNIDYSKITLIQLRDLMAQLPNLDDLSLSGYFVPVDKRELVGIGTVLRGRFGGRLIRTLNGDDKDVIDMLLEIPSGLHFTEVRLDGSSKGLPSAIRLAEACGKTAVKLSHWIESYGNSRHFSWSGWFYYANINAYATSTYR